MKIHRDKTKITEVKDGVTFLGKHLLPYRTYICPRCLKRIRNRLEYGEKKRVDLSVGLLSVGSLNICYLRLILSWDI